ncbi:ligand-gated channel [Shewanella sp. NFH-SH190041]|nr:ligand-gated channel [Shewanella sp. NFH-SH190041]
MIKRKKLACCIGLICSQGLLPAQAQNNDEYYLDEVVVSATRTEQQVRDIAASISRVDAKQIEQSMAQDLQQALADEPGVTLSGTGRFGLSGVNIRGRDANYVKTLVDGVELPAGYNPGADMMRKYNNTIELDTLAVLEVNKGPISSLYGSDALAGTMVVRTKDPADLLADGDGSAFGVKSGYASADDSVKATAEMANRTGALETLFIYTHRQGHEQKTHGGADIVGENRGEADPLNYRSDNLLAKVYYQLNDAHTLGLAAEHFTREQNIDLLSREGDSIKMGPLVYLYSDVHGRDEDSRTRVSIEHDWQANITLFDQLQWQLAYLQSDSNHDNYDHLDKEMHGKPLSSQNRNRHRAGEDNSWQADIQLLKALEFNHGYHELIYGASYIRNEFSLHYQDIDMDTGKVTDKHAEVPGAKSDKWGVFIQDQMFLAEEKLVLNTGLRYDKFKAQPDAISGYASAENDALTARLGAVYHWNNTLSSYTQISQGFKAPTVQDLYYSYEMGAVLAPNPDLKAEESLAYEMGLRYNTEATKLTFATYYNDYKNFIEDKMINPADPEHDGKEVWTKVNVARAKIYGAEFSANWDLAKLFTAPNGLTAGFNVNYSKGEDKQTGAAIDTVAPLSSSASLGYDAPDERFGGKLTVTAVAGKSGNEWSNDNEVDNIKAPGYVKADLTTYYQPVHGLMIRAGLFNVTDVKYWDYMDLAGIDKGDTGLDRRTQPGRNWGVDVSYRF